MPTGIIYSQHNKQLFRDILDAFLKKHAFDLPKLVHEPAAAERPTPSPTPAAAAVPATK